MKLTLIRVFTLALTLVGAAYLALSAGPGAFGNSQPERDFSNLTLEIRVKEKLLPLEPVPITITLSNKSNRVITGHTAIAFSENHIELFVAPHGGEFKRVESLSALRAQIHVERRDIQPGEQHETVELLALGLDKVFPEAGRYRLQAMLHDIGRKQEVKSNVINLNVADPAGPDHAAFEFVRSKSNASDFFSGLGLASSSRARNEMEMLAATFSESPYADYANYLLGELFFFKEEYVKANEKFSKLAGKSEFAHAKKVKEYLREIKDKLPAAQVN